jgi:hypothetical protein
MIFPPIDSGAWRIMVEADAKSVSVRVQRFGAFTGLDPEMRVILPEGETRTSSVSRS